MKTLIPAVARSGAPSVQFRRGSIAIAVAAAIASSANAADTAKAPADESSLTEVVVTGTRIATRDYSSPSPIVTVGADALKNTSEISIEQALSQLPQFHPGSNQFNQASNVQATAASSPGIATVNLRGLGPNRNLVLIDGRRAQPADASLAVDVNTIPTAALESVEVVTGGAGATYGADALAGVVNFKLKHRFEGAEFDAQYGETGRGDDKNEHVSALIGANMADNRGNVMLGLDYSTRSPVLVGNRPFFNAANTDPNSPGGAFPGFPGFNLIPYVPGSFSGATPFGWNVPTQTAVNSVFGTYPGGTVSNFSPLYFNTAPTTGGATVFSVSPGAGGQQAPGYSGPLYPNYKYLSNGSLATNNNPDGPISAPMTRYSLFSSANYDITDNITADLQGNFVHNEVKTSFGTASPAVNQWGVNIPYSQATDDPSSEGYNPALGHAVPSELATLLNSRPNNSAPWQLNTFPNYVGDRRMDVVTDTYQMSLGFKGNLGLKDWTWDAYSSIGSTDQVANYFGFLDRARYQALISAPNYGAGYSFSDGLNGQLATCTSGLNPFLNTPVSQDCINIIDAKLKTTTTIGQRIVELNFQGAGFNLPAGESRFAFGADYRSDTIAYRPDAGMSATNILSNAIGIFGANDVAGSENVKEIYGEADLPLLANMAGAKKLDLNLGYRYSDYDTNAGGVDTWKAMLNWAVNDYVSFRGGLQRANRAPNVAELFTPPTVLVTLWPDSDPCANTTIAAYGNVAANPNRGKVQTLCNLIVNPAGGGAGPINNGFSGLGFYFPLALDQQIGNTQLKSEQGTTWTIGTVLRSPFEAAAASALTATVDYYHIKITNAITSLTSQIVYAECLNANGTSNPNYDPTNSYCQLIQRSAAGATDTVLGYFSNIGLIETNGIDVVVDWRAKLNDMGLSAPGALSANLAYSHLLAYKVQVTAGDPTVDYKGTTGFDTGSGVQFSWKSVLTLAYTVGPASVSVHWRHLPSVENVAKLLNPGSSIADTASNDQFDLFGGWQITDKVSLRAGVQNVLDKQPPIVGASPGNSAAGTTDASGVYDVLGRRYFLGLKAKL